MIGGMGGWNEEGGAFARLWTEADCRRERALCRQAGGRAGTASQQPAASSSQQKAPEPSPGCSRIGRVTERADQAYFWPGHHSFWKPPQSLVGSGRESAQGGWAAKRPGSFHRPSLHARSWRPSASFPLFLLLSAYGPVPPHARCTACICCDLSPCRPVALQSPRAGTAHGHIPAPLSWPSTGVQRRRRLTIGRLLPASEPILPRSPALSAPGTAPPPTKTPMAVTAVARLVCPPRDSLVLPSATANKPYELLRPFCHRSAVCTEVGHLSSTPRDVP